MERIITEEILKQFQEHLIEEERSTNTVTKYLCDVRKLKTYAAGREITKNLSLDFKNMLLKEGGYEVSSINSFLTAINRFFEFMGWYDVRVKLYRIQRNTFASEEQFMTKEEYKRLVNTARKNGNKRLVMILNTICATGIRISELEYFTVESVNRKKVVIHNKGKIRNILIPEKLQDELKKYIQQNQIQRGCIFCTKTGKALHRSNIWREMKALCHLAEVKEEKVFPHNLRHLFAQCFYEIKQDLAKLADVLGHGSIETTRIYIRTTGEEYLKQIEQLKLVC